MNILAEIIKVQNERILFIYLLPKIVTIELLAWRQVPSQLKIPCTSR